MAPPGTPFADSVRVRVLLITQYFPPDQTVGALRVQKVCEALLEAGHTVHVITARNPSDHSAWRESGHPGLRIECVRSLPTLRDAYLALRRHFSDEPEQLTSLKDGSSRGEAKSLMARRHGPRGYLARLTAMVIRFPDVWAGFALPAALTAWSRHHAEAFDRLYTSGPPHSTHGAGWLFQRLTGIPWALEMRDPWTDDPRRLREQRFAPLDRLDAWLESHCLQAASWIMALTDGGQALYRAKLSPTARSKVSTVRSGIPVLRPPLPVPEPAASRRIVYTGALYAERDPEPFLRALAAVVQRRGLGPAALRLRLVGHCRYYHGRSVAALVAELGLAPWTDFIDWVPPQQVREELDAASLLLLWARRQPNQVPNKLYEYLGARVPIFAIADEAGETARLLRQVGGHTIIDSEDPDRLAGALERAMAGTGAAAASPGAEQVLGKLATRTQMRRLVELLEGR